MDLTTALMLVALIVVGISSVVSVLYGGLVLAVIVATVAIIGLAFIPATPIIPTWIAVGLIMVEMIYAAAKLAGIFSFDGGGNVGRGS